MFGSNPYISIHVYLNFNQMRQISFLSKQKCRAFPAINITLTGLTQSQGIFLSFQGKTPRQLKSKNQYDVSKVAILYKHGVRT